MKPCPFCGGKAIYCYTDYKGMKTTFDGHVVPTWSENRYSTRMGHIGCHKCGVTQTREYSTISSAEKAWNRRAKVKHD